MKKPWSVTTTVRNPGRLRDFLVVLRELENSEWNHENQMKYQVLLIQNRLYGYKKPQFYNNLSQDKVDLIDDYSKEISFEAAEEIFNEKDYEDPPMRGRQSLNPLKKLGFVSIESGAVVITDLGRLFLKDDFRDNLGEIFLRSFLKMADTESRQPGLSEKRKLRYKTVHWNTPPDKRGQSKGNKRRKQPEGNQQKGIFRFRPDFGAP